MYLPYVQVADTWTKKVSNVKRHCTRRLGCVCHEDRTPKHKKQYKVSVNEKIPRGKSKI